MCQIIYWEIEAHSNLQSVSQDRMSFHGLILLLLSFASIDFIDNKQLFAIRDLQCDCLIQSH